MFDDIKKSHWSGIQLKCSSEQQEGTIIQDEDRQMDCCVEDHLEFHSAMISAMENAMNNRTTVEIFLASYFNRPPGPNSILTFRP